MQRTSEMRPLWGRPVENELPVTVCVCARESLRSQACYVDLPVLLCVCYDVFLHGRKTLKGHLARGATV